MIMEGITERVTPILKCMVLLLLIFTAKVLTSRPQENGDSKNSIQQAKPNHYVRTFTKYHHVRMPADWPVTEHKIIKRNVNDQSKELIDSALDIPNLNFGNDKQKFIKEDSGKNGLTDIKKYKVKAAIKVTDPPKVFKPGISCLYKIHSVAFSVTPSYDDETNDYHQQVVENEHFDTPGVISETTLPSGEVVQVEQCTEPRASCYILWHQDDGGNTTVLGQGCWRSGAGAACDRCTRVSPRLPGTKFCCCTKPFCNADFLSIKEEIITPIAASTIDSKSQQMKYTSILMVLMGGAGLALGLVACRRLYWPRRRENTDDTEKGEVIGNGPDGLATGLSCVDNLTLIEHIGQGKFGSVWRGTLGSTPVAVKLYSSAAAWQREVAVYSMPHIRHANMLHYYGSDTRRNLTDGMGRSRLIVVELCAETLRGRLRRALAWDTLAHVAHGLSSAVAHLHSSTPTKPCIVHRDINSNNVLITHDGQARLADLGLTQVRRDDGDTRIAEAGTLRYLAPEALEGALDLSGARAALCAVDVYALGLVLWEMLWVASGREAALPFQHAGLPPRHTPAMMQNLVCRNKARPPLPKGPVQEQKALKVMCATCEECWDHDAEARLTAVCVEERMLELQQALAARGPVIHDNNLHPNTESPPEPDKNSNCLQTQNCDVRTPLLYTHPHIGRNPCMERNTNTQTNTIELIHKSLKDITVPTESGPRVDNEEQCLSVARINPHRVQINENSERNHERSYQRPLEYIPNEINSEERGLKETNLHTRIEKPKWGIKKFFEKYKTKDTEVKIVQDVMKTSVVKDVNVFRPADLVLNKRLYNFEPPCLSPPNRTLSPTMMIESDLNRDNRVFGYKEIPHEEEKQIFAVIVPKVRRGSSDSMNKSVKTSMSSQSEDSTIKKRLSCDKAIINNNSGRSSRASINLELQYLEQSPFGLNSECSSSEDEHLMLLSENGTKITMQTIKDKDVLKESQPKDFLNKANNKYSNFDNEYSDPNDKENTNFVENPVYIATFDGPKNVIKRQHSLEQVSEIFSSSSDVHLQNPAGRVKTPGDLPIAIRKARREKFRGKANETNRLSLYDDRMMFGNSL